MIGARKGVRRRPAGTDTGAHYDATYLGAGQDNLARDEDEEYDFGLDHTVDQAGKQLRAGEGQPAHSRSLNRREAR